MFLLVVLLDRFGSEEDTPHGKEPLQAGQSRDHDKHQCEHKEQLVQITIRLMNELIIEMATGVVINSFIVREC